MAMSTNKGANMNQLEARRRLVRLGYTLNSGPRACEGGYEVSFSYNGNEATAFAATLEGLVESAVRGANLDLASLLKGNE